MSERLYESLIWRERMTPAIWVAVALSLLVHAAALWEWLPRMRLPSLAAPERGAADGPLMVRLAPPPSPPPAPLSLPAPQTPPSPTSQARPPNAVARPQRSPPVLALNRPAPNIQTPPAVTAPASARPPAGGDLSSYIEAQRRARAEPAPAASAGSVSNAPQAEDDDARTNRIVAANLAPQRAPTFGYDPTRVGGIFQIERMGYDSAEFTFYGWNQDIRRNTAQLIEVRKGSNSDIRIAIIRRMIAIIRQYQPEDFLWESQRLGRNITLSARARDNAGLEDFLMVEFFGDPHRPQP